MLIDDISLINRVSIKKSICEVITMKNNLNMFLFYMILGIILMTVSVTATLQYYFTFGDGDNSTTIYDTENGYLMDKISYPDSNQKLFTTTGKIQSTLYSNYTWMRFGTQDNININLGGDSYSMNFWVKITNISYIHKIYFGANSLTYSQGTLDYQHWLQFLVSSGKLRISTYYYHGGSNYQISYYTSGINATEWSMITYEWIGASKRMLIYFNGVNVINTTYTSVRNDLQYLIFDEYKGIQYDELSIFKDELLTQSQIDELYNNGTGLDYTDTKDIVVNETEENYTFDGYYHDYCFYYINCQNYNVAEDYCEDEVYKVCSQSSDTEHPEYACADTFDAYKSIGLENVTPSFSAQCYNDTYYYQYPSYEGLNGSILRNICYGEYLCKIYNITANISCPVYINNTPNKIDCRQETGSIVATCHDTFSIYNSLNTYPPNNDYQGYCSECSNDCIIENSTSCLDSRRVQACRKYSSCLIWFTVKTCENDKTCDLGMCVLNSTLTGIPDTPDTPEEMSIAEKHFIWAIVITIIFSLLVASLIGFVGSNSQNIGAIAMLGFLFVFLAGLVFFSLPMIEWMNPLFALLVGLLDAIFIALIIKMIFFTT
jgi:hypothetical protein